MSVTTRLSVLAAATAEADEAERSGEDFLFESLGVIFPDDVGDGHNDPSRALRYTSPRLPRPLDIALADPQVERDRTLFSHLVWNSGLVLADAIEAASVASSSSSSSAGDGAADSLDVRGLDTLELGAGTALPSMAGALLGARRTVVTDYPSPVVLETLRLNIARNVRAEDVMPRTVGRASSSSSSSAAASTADAGPLPPSVLVEGHVWGELETAFAVAHRASFDRVLVCDCLWMPWQHRNLQRSIAWFLKDPPETATAWIVAGFHTGRNNVKKFFETPTAADGGDGGAGADADGAGDLAAVGLEIVRIWERDCGGREREWDPDRDPYDDATSRKRWQVMAILRKKRTEETSATGGGGKGGGEGGGEGGDGDGQSGSG